MIEPEKRIRYETEEQFHIEFKKTRIRKIDWGGPGWYFIFFYTQLCSRGCCDEYVCEAKSVKLWAEEISNQIKKLELDLKEVLKLENENE